MVLFSCPRSPAALEASGANATPPGPRYGIIEASCVHLSSVINRYEIMRPQFVVLAAGSPLLEPGLPPNTASGEHVLEEPGISQCTPASPGWTWVMMVKILVSPGLVAE